MSFAVEVAHTSQLAPDVLAACRELMYAAFDDMTEPDWEHALGGMHAVARADSAVVGHASLIQRRLLHGGRALRAGYVEAVAVRSGFRRRGIGAALMSPLEHMIETAFEIGALGATDEAVPFYTGRGWQRWLGRAAALTPAGIVGTPEDEGAIFVWPVRPGLDLSGELTCDWRDGDVW